MVVKLELGKGSRCRVLQVILADLQGGLRGIFGVLGTVCIRKFKNSWGLIRKIDKSGDELIQVHEFISWLFSTPPRYTIDKKEAFGKEVTDVTFFNDFKDEGKVFTVTWSYHFFLKGVRKTFLVSGNPFFVILLVVHSSSSSGDLYQLSKRGVFRRQSLQLCADAWGITLKIRVAPEGTRAIKIQSPCTLQRCLDWRGRYQGDCFFFFFSIIFRLLIVFWLVIGWRRQRPVSGSFFGEDFFFSTSVFQL